MPTCDACFVKWVVGGRYLSMRFPGSSAAEQLVTYLCLFLPAKSCRQRSGRGRLITETEGAAVPGVSTVLWGRRDVWFGPDTYVYPKLTSHRSLFRIPLD
jgi:hypothetical protein